MFWLIGTYVVVAITVAMVMSYRLIKEKSKYSDPKILPWDLEWQMLIFASLLWPAAAFGWSMCLLMSGCKLITSEIDEKIFNKLAIKMREKRNLHESGTNGKDTK